MSYVVSAPDVGGTPFLVVQRTSFGPRRPATRSRYELPVGPPPIALTGSSVLQLATSLALGVLYPTYTTNEGQVLGVYIVEKARSRSTKTSFDGRSLTRIFLIHGSNDPAAVSDIGPKVGDQDATYPEFFVEERNGQTYATGGGEADIVQLTIEYKRFGPEQGDGGSESLLSFEFGSESEHVDIALSQASHGTGASERVGNLINVTDDEIQGLEINAPILEFQEEHWFTTSRFSPAFRRLLATTTQTVNAAAFREWAIGEVLFVGASARKSAGQWNVTFSFRVRRNLEDLAFTLVKDDGTDEPVVVTKRGWEYLWIESRRLPEAGATATKTRTVPRAVHVAAVYYATDFSIFGIGTNPLP